MAPTTTKQWTISGNEGFGSLEFHEKAQLPPVADHDVLVKFHAASLNFRDLVIPQGTYPGPWVPNVVPGSDGAGEVISIGSKLPYTRVA